MIFGGESFGSGPFGAMQWLAGGTPPIPPVDSFTAELGTFKSRLGNIVLGLGAVAILPVATGGFTFGGMTCAAAANATTPSTSASAAIVLAGMKATVIVGVDLFQAEAHVTLGGMTMGAEAVAAYHSQQAFFFMTTMYAGGF